MVKSLKIKFVLIAALALAFVLTLGTFFGLTLTAKALRRVTISNSEGVGNNVFYSSGDAKIWSHEEVTAGEEGEEDIKKYYSMFVLTSGKDAINFRKNLAYNWYYNTAEEPDEKDEDDKKDEENGEASEKTPVTAVKAEGFFNMEIGFEEIYFKRYIITFESQQYYQTKDKKTANYIIFVPEKDEDGNLNGRLKVIITSHLPESDDDDQFVQELNIAETVFRDHIKIEFTGREYDKYLVKVSNPDLEDAAIEGAFENVGGTYARYSSSSVTPVMPLSFKAVFEDIPDEDDEDAVDNYNAKAYMALYNLNGQSFELIDPPKQTDGHFPNGAIDDDTPAVLCLGSGISFIEGGEEISFDYTVIDVITSSAKADTGFFMLLKSQAEKADFNADDYSENGPFTPVKDSDNWKMSPNVNSYVPTEEDCNKATAFGGELEAVAAVKIYVKLTDTSSDNHQETYVMLDWYVDDDCLLEIGGNKYIAVASYAKGQAFSYTESDTTDPDNNATWKAIVDAYQDLVTEAAQGLEAGNDSYFYLPSMDNIKYKDPTTGEEAVGSLFADSVANYSDIKVSIYYNNGSQQSSTNNSTNSLSFTLSNLGKYYFTVYATYFNDKDGNSVPMYYYNADGEETSFKSSDIWHMLNEDEDYEGQYKYLPRFEFTVKNLKLEIEDPKDQDIAYVGTTYSGISFSIQGRNYGTPRYQLYILKNDMYYQEFGTSIDYATFMATKDELLEKHRNLFDEILPTAGSSKNVIEENHEDYAKYAPYEWNDSALSFVPQDGNSFYIVRCTATSQTYANLKETATMGICASVRVEPLKGEDTWVQDNLTSIILLCVAGASLIGIILLLVIKPKDKSDVEEKVAVNTKKKK